MNQNLRKGMKNRMELIKAEKIEKKFGDGKEAKTVLNHVSVTIEKGEFVAIMGASGSGKSTLLYALSGMDHIDGGEVFFEGKALKGCKEEELSELRREKMGFIFQQPTMLKNLNILDNILFPTLRTHKGDKSAVERAKMLMKQTGIGGIEKNEISEVSGGQLQRAGICRALMGQPDIIFADEPTGALNSKTAAEIMDLLVEINQKGTAILIVTHDAKVAARADRILFLSDGKIAKELAFQKENTNMEHRCKEVLEIMGEIGV